MATPAKHVKFLEDHDDGRLRPSTLRLLSCPPEDSEIFEVVLYKGGTVVCVAVALTRGTELLAACMVTHRAHRRQGYASLALRLKVSALTRQGVPYVAGVAEDNHASLATVRRAGLVATSTRECERISGTYTQYLFTPKGGTRLPVSTVCRCDECNGEESHGRDTTED